MGLTCIYISGIKIITKTLQVNEEKRQLHMVLTHSSIRQNVWVRQPSVHSTSCYKTIWSRKVSHNSHSKLNLYSSAMVVEIPHKCPSTILLCHGYEHPYIAHLLCFLLLLSPLHPTPHPSFFIFHSILLVSAQGLDTERERIIMKLVKTATVWSDLNSQFFHLDSDLFMAPSLVSYNAQSVVPFPPTPTTIFSFFCNQLADNSHPQKEKVWQPMSIPTCHVLHTTIQYRHWMLHPIISPDTPIPQASCFCMTC